MSRTVHVLAYCDPGDYYPSLEVLGVFSSAKRADDWLRESGVTDKDGYDVTPMALNDVEVLGPPAKPDYGNWPDTEMSRVMKATTAAMQKTFEQDVLKRRKILEYLRAPKDLTKESEVLFGFGTTQG